ncbi:hypothetical protein ACF07S_09965 [Streptomyces sp. NPDC016640]|uniref:hypothetical protein n=1 Tax=Streptomyces sp. NPDC016640 TaxID=3364969 RepID=UPI00370232E1
MNAEQWNALYPVGTPVFAYPGFRPEDASDARRLVTRTRTAAQVSASGHPVVWVEGEGSYICLTHVDPVSEEQFAEARKAVAAAAVAATPALPVPVGDQPQPLTDERLAGIAARTPERAAALTAWLDKFAPVDGQRALENAETVLGEDVPALLAEIQRLKAELAKYVGKEPTVAEEMEYLSRCLDAVRDLCDEAEKQATRWENPLPVPEWVEQVRAAASGERPEDPNDNRRRIYVDGKGNGWISVCHDEGTEWVVPVQPEVAVEQDVRDVADETGSLREIGRCW